MKMPMVLLPFAIIAWVMGVTAACAQAYPSRPIKVIVPYPAGGVVDALTRAIGEKVRASLGQPWVIENKPGAGASIGLQACATADPDGYTFCAATNESFTITPHYDAAMYDRFKSLVPVTEFASGVGVAYAHAGVPAGNLRDLVNLSRLKPNEFTYGSFGPGSAPQLLFEWLRKSEQAEFLHVPFKGSQEVVTDMLAGRTQVSFVALGLVVPHFKSGALKPLAIIGKQRSPLFPDVPTIYELGFKFPEMGVWFGLAAPKGTPETAIEMMAQAVRSAVSDPELKARFLDPQAFNPVGSSPSDFRAKVKSESSQGAELIRESGVRAQ